MASMGITESGFQTPASKKRKASDLHSLPPASQPTMPPTSYKNRSPLIVKGIDPKYNTQILSEPSKAVPQSFPNPEVAKWLDFYRRYS